MGDVVVFTMQVGVNQLLSDGPAENVVMTDNVPPALTILGVTEMPSGTGGPPLLQSACVCVCPAAETTAG